MAENKSENKSDNAFIESLANEIAIDESNDLNNELISAVMRGSIKDTKSLILNKKININFKDEQGNTALHWGCYFDEINVIKILLTHNNIDISIKNKRGNNCIMLGCIANSFKTIKYLLELNKNNKINININDLNKWNETALHLASSVGKIEIIKVLCQYGANLSIKDNWERTPLRIAFENGYNNAVNVLKEYCDESVILEAKNVDNSQTVHKNGNNNKQLINEFMKEAKIKLDKIKKGNVLETMKVNHAFDVKGKVVDKKATVKVTKKPNKKLGQLFEYGKSPKDVNELKAFLKDDTIDNNGCDMFGWNALHKSIFWMKLDYVKLLLKYMDKDGLNKIGGEGDTPLIMSLKSGIEVNDLSIFKMLFSCDKIDINSKNKKGKTIKDIAKQLKVNKDILTLIGL